MIGLQRLEIKGKRFVLLEETEYERLCREAREAVAEDDLPPLPKPDKNGRFPAVEYARTALARDVIRDRKGVGLSQQQLAYLAGIRQETLSRIESGKHLAKSGRPGKGYHFGSGSGKGLDHVSPGPDPTLLAGKRPRRGRVRAFHRADLARAGPIRIRGGTFGSAWGAAGCPVQDGRPCLFFATRRKWHRKPVEPGNARGMAKEAGKAP